MGYLLKFCFLSLSLALTILLLNVAPVPCAHLPQQSKDRMFLSKKQLSPNQNEQRKLDGKISLMKTQTMETSTVGTSSLVKNKNLYVDLAKTGIENTEKMRVYVKDASETRIYYFRSYSAKNKIFLMAGLTVAACCVGLQFILNQAKDARIIITNHENKLKREITAQQNAASQPAHTETRNVGA